jgi:hypothetical protein
MSQTLQDAYSELLRERGLALPGPPPGPKVDAAILLLASEAYKSSGYSGDLASFLQSKQGGFGVDFMQAVADRVKESGLGHQFELDAARKRVEAAVSLARYRLSDEVFVGEFPTRSFNAQATRVGPGFLVLINSGLFSFVHTATKIFSLSVEFADFGPDGRHIPSTRTGRSDFSEDEKQEAMTELILAYLLYGDARKATRFAFQHPRKMNAAGAMCDACVLFAVAHEYGHVIGGHLGSARSKTAQTPVGPLDVLEKSYKQEFEADGLGARLVVLSAGRLENNKLVFGVDAQHWIDIDTTLSGPLLFLRLDRLVTRVASEICGTDEFLMYGDHPPSDARISVVRTMYAQFGLTELRKLSSFCVEWIDAMEEGVLGFVRSNLPRIRQRFQSALGH